MAKSNISWLTIIKRSRSWITDSAIEYRFLWKDLNGDMSYNKVCFEFKEPEVYWYSTFLGKGTLQFPLDSSDLNPIRLGQDESLKIVEPIYLRSDGFAIALDDLHNWELSQNKSHYCFNLETSIEPSEHAEQFKQLEFRILVAQNIQILYQSLVKDFQYIRRPITVPNKLAFSRPVWPMTSILGIKEYATAATVNQNAAIQFLDLAELLSKYGFKNSTIFMIDYQEKKSKEPSYMNILLNRNQFDNVAVSLEITASVYEKLPSNSKIQFDKDTGIYNLFDAKTFVYFTSRLYQLLKQNNIESIVCQDDSMQLSKLESKYVQFISTLFGKACTAASLGSVILTKGFKSQAIPGFFQLQVWYKVIPRSDINDFHETLKPLIMKLLIASLAGHQFLSPLAVYEPDSNAPDDLQFPPPPKLLWYIRWLQIVVFMPQMNIPALPWIYQNQVDSFSIMELVQGYLRFRHQIIVPKLVELAERWIRFGEPIIRPMWYAEEESSSPKAIDKASFNISDQFMLGTDLVIAPFWDPDHDSLKNKTHSRMVYLPAGEWIDPRKGNPILRGPRQFKFESEITVLSYFRRFAK